MHGVFGNGELLALSFLAFLQAGLWAKLLLLKHQDRDLLLQRYIKIKLIHTIVQLHIYAVVRLSACVSMSASLHVVNMFFFFVNHTPSCT